MVVFFGVNYVSLVSFILGGGGGGGGAVSGGSLPVMNSLGALVDDDIACC